MDRSSPETGLPAMSYTSAEMKPRATPLARPTEHQIRSRAHEIWRARDGAPGNPTLDWLEAEMELEAELRTGHLTPGRLIPAPARAPGRAASMVEARPEAPSRFAREDAPRERSRAA